MLPFIIRRLLISIPILLLVVTLVFFIFQVIPGDPAIMFAGDQASPEQLAEVRKELGIDQPILVQYSRYMQRLAQADLGKSYITRRLVIVEIIERFENTVRLAGASILLASVFGVLLGATSAKFRETPLDYGISIFALFGISMPVFWFGLLLMLIFSIYLGWLPTAGNRTFLHSIMPTICLSLYSFAFITRMSRSSFLEIFNEDYIRTARAKGLKERLVIWRHVFRNALIPIVTVVGLQFGYMLGGAVITESIFAWPGMGRLMVFAVQQRDMPIVQGILLVIALIFVLINLFVDVLYGIIDPRVRVQ